LGRHFIIITDQKTSSFYNGKRVMSEEYIKWNSKVMSLDYHPGKENEEWGG